MFDTHTGNEIIFGIPEEVKKAMRKKDASAKIDALCGLTFGLHEYNYWMHDNEVRSFVLMRPRCSHREEISPLHHCRVRSS